MDTLQPPRDRINDRYVSAIKHLIENNRLKNQRDFSVQMEESSTILSQIKSGKRNASIMQVAKAVNLFDLNANYFLKYENEKESVEHSRLNINPTISGSNKDVMVGKNEGIVQGSFYNVERLIQEAPTELREHIGKLQSKYEDLEKENDKCQDEISELKKIINNQNSQLTNAYNQIREKDERLYKAQCELIEVYKQQKK